ncbi:hypothetical protein [uncultured Algoriphagus sp.]|uniref:hypothetical protein n=1 Tax=uncultured Algoriphagus sp. TaxID=417365 RepID=UPI0025937A77|nr:hypothetical protein [uncultured Algoriphagus sp.]
MKKTDFHLARKKLLIHWMIGSLVIFVTYFVIARMGRFGASESKVWTWLFQFLLPPLSLMIGVLIVSVREEPSNQQVDSFYFRLTMGMSYFFLLLIFLSAILVPLIHLQQNTDLTVIEQSPLIDAFHSYDSVLIPIQGLSTLTLGIFFSKK